MPTDLIENFLNKELENNPAKLMALKYDPFIIVTALVPPPQFVIKSLNINANELRLPKAQA